MAEAAGFAVLAPVYPENPRDTAIQPHLAVNPALVSLDDPPERTTFRSMAVDPKLAYPA